MRRLRKFFALARSDRLMLVEAWLYLGAARLALIGLPFRVLSRRLGPRFSPEERPSAPPAVPPLARRVARAVDIMSRHTPWESACLAQAVAGKFMLRRRGVPAQLYLGTRKDQAGNLAAHAWLRVGNSILLGGAGHDTFTVLAAFGDSAGP